MYKDEYKAVCNSAATKLNLLKTNPLGYFVASMLAGMFVAMGGFLAFTLAGHLSTSETAAIWAKPAQSAAFAAALGNYFENLAITKTTTAPMPLFFKAVLCNILVCLAVWCGIKMKSESGKLIMIFWCIFVFMVCGFEHSIANMSSIGISLFTGKVGIGAYLYNVVVVTLGNMVGGILGVAFPYHLISKEK